MKPVMHPNGFVQLPLNEESTVKLHVWPEAPPEGHAGDFTIHDHVWDLESRVLMGKLWHITHLVDFRDELPAAEPYGRIWQEWSVADRPAEGTSQSDHTRLLAAKGGSALQPTGRYALTESMLARRYGEGDEYEFTRRSFHTSGAEGLTATLMRKITYPNPGAPRVLCKLDHTPDELFGSKYGDGPGWSEEALWLVIRQALIQMSPRSYHEVKYASGGSWWLKELA